MRLIALLVIVLLAACGSPAATPPPTVLTGQEVIDKFISAGIMVSDVSLGERAEGTPLPNTYKENLSFTIAEVAPHGGQIFVCTKREYCNALMAYFGAFKALVGPYLYQSPNGLVVAQLNSGLSVETAEKFEAVIKGLP